MSNRGAENCWQVGKTVLSANQYMFENQLCTDVFFNITCNVAPTRIGAHKYVLISRSPVFEAMLCGNMMENADGNESIVHITDIDADSFQETLRFIYCEQANLTLHNVCSVLYASKKYLLPSLTNQCKLFLERNLEVENVCIIIDQSITYDEHELTNKCLEFISPRARIVFGNDSFLNLSQAALSKIIDCDNLYVESESWLFKECLRWARHHEAMHMFQKVNFEPNEIFVADEDRIRKILGDIVFKIRFLLMDAVEFAREVGSENILQDNEKSLLYYHILTGEHLPQGSTFKQSNRVNICNRFTSTGSAQQWWSCNGPTDAISFSSDVDVDLVGVVLYGGKSSSQHEVNAEVCLVGDSADDLTRLASAEYVINSDGSSSPWPVYFTYPVSLQSKLLYTILVTMKGPLTHYGTNGKEFVTSCGVTFNFSSSSKSTNGTNVKSGQIPQLVFMRKNT